MIICSSTPQAHGRYINSSLLEGDLKMSKSHATVLSYDENVSYLSSTTNLYERKEHFLMSKTATENRANIGTIDEIMRHQRTYVATQDNKHCSKDLRTDSSLNTGRNGHEEVSKRSRSKSKFTCKYAFCDREPSRLPFKKIIKMFKKVSQA